MTAQPTLPDLAGSADKGIVILSWVCQFDKVKSIAVLRSSDSNNINQTVGYVKMLDKGPQAFADAHPHAGKNFYKLNITFKSGLSWGSNRVRVFVDKASLQDTGTLPANDSIQRYVTASKRDNGSTPSKIGASSKRDTTGGSTEPTKKNNIHISFEIDSNTVNTQTYSNTTTVPRKKITINFDEENSSPATLVQSRFIATDPETGHVNMNLPEDVATHHYSVKFYDDRNKMVLEVPRINASKIIIDKRNFQKSGIYKFVLRRDVVELESGYFAVEPNP